MNSIPDGGWSLLALVPVLILVPLLISCASTTPGLDEHFGEASRKLRAQQLIDANAPQKNQAARTRADGRSVHEANERYLDSFKAPPPPTVINIGGAAR